MSEPLRLTQSDRYEAPLQLKRAEVIVREAEPLDLGKEARRRDPGEPTDPVGARARLKALADGFQRSIDEGEAPATAPVEPLSPEPLTGFSYSVAGRAETPKALEVAIQRVVGDGAALQVSLNGPDGERLYRAVDADTGKTVREWPEAAFFELVKGVREDVFADIDAEKIV